MTTQGGNRAPNDSGKIEIRRKPDGSVHVDMEFQTQNPETDEITKVKKGLDLEGGTPREIAKQVFRAVKKESDKVERDWAK